MEHLPSLCVRRVFCKARFFITRSPVCRANPLQLRIAARRATLSSSVALSWAAEQCIRSIAQLPVVYSDVPNSAALQHRRLCYVRIVVWIFHTSTLRETASRPRHVANNGMRYACLARLQPPAKAGFEPAACTPGFGNHLLNGVYSVNRSRMLGRRPGWRWHFGGIALARRPPAHTDCGRMRAPRPPFFFLSNLASGKFVT